MKKISLLICFAFLFSFCCACNAVTPGPCTTRSSAAALATPASVSETAAPETAPEASTEAMTQAPETETAAEKGDLRVAVEAVNIRDGIGTESTNIVGTLNEGESILVLSEQDGWAEVLYDGNHCYMASAYLVPAEEE